MNSYIKANGFEWGPVVVARLFCDDKNGTVTLGIETDRDKLQVYVTRTGKVRVWNARGEMTNEEVEAEGGEGGAVRQQGWRPRSRRREYHPVQHTA